MTAREVFEKAVALVDGTDSSGSITAQMEESYAGAAPQIIGMLQRELAAHEGVSLTGEVESLEDVLEISDDAAARILPYGVAASFALADKNGDMHSEYSLKYRTLIQTMQADETDISDEYDVLGGMT